MFAGPLHADRPRDRIAVHTYTCIHTSRRASSGPSPRRRRPPAWSPSASGGTRPPPDRRKRAGEADCGERAEGEGRESGRDCGGRGAGREVEGEHRGGGGSERGRDERETGAMRMRLDQPRPQQLRTPAAKLACLVDPSLP